MSRRSFGFSIVIIATSTCAAWLWFRQDRIAKLEICEATIRSQWRADGLNPETVFLGTGSMLDSWVEDFPDEFYRRFSDLARQVHKGSEFQVSEKNWLWFCETPKRVDASTFAVRSGHWCGNLCFSRCLYTLRQKNGHWVVEKSEDCIVS